jgi:hypothetical protein
MVDAKEIEQLRTDLELVTKTAEVLATKLEKISQKVEALLAAMGTKEGIPPSTPSHQAVPPVREPVATPRPEAPQRTRSATPLGEASSKAGRLLDSFLTNIQNLSKGREFSDALSQLRDQVMQSAEVGFHPAFHEMGRYAGQLKNINVINDEEREALIEKIYDWKERLS